MKTCSHLCWVGSLFPYVLLLGGLGWLLERGAEVKQRKEMASQQHIEKMQLRQNFRNFWHADLFTTIQSDTPCKFYLPPTYSLTHTHLIYSSHILSQNMQIVALLSGGKSSVPSCFQFFTHLLLFFFSNALLVQSQL